MDWMVVAVALPSVVVAYVIFGIAGFGTALVSAPILAQTMPVAKVVPLLALLDFIVAAASGLRMNKNVVVDELRWLVPCMVAGSLIGVWALLVMPPQAMTNADRVLQEDIAHFQIQGAPKVTHLIAPKEGAKRLPVPRRG